MYSISTNWHDFLKIPLMKKVFILGFLPVLAVPQTAERRRPMELRTCGSPFAVCLCVDKTTWARGASLKRRGIGDGEDMEVYMMPWARRVWWLPQKALCPSGTSTFGPHEGPTSLTNSRSSNHLKVREKGSTEWAARRGGGGKSTDTEGSGQRKEASGPGGWKGRGSGRAGMDGCTRGKGKEAGDGRGRPVLG